MPPQAEDPSSVVVTREDTTSPASSPTSLLSRRGPSQEVVKPLGTPSFVARYACVAVLLAVFGIWAKFSFYENELDAPSIGRPMHSYMVPLVLTLSYIVSLPLLQKFSTNYLSKKVDTKALLKETMIVYNGGQVLLNAWMVYRFIYAVMYNGHPFVGNHTNVTSGATFAVWIHYTDKYLEFFDTYFMVLRGRMDQVSFLHVYHHMSIAWAWWIALSVFPGGDAYFGALLNSFIHVLMYSYYTLSLLKIPCPWKRFLTQAQLMQFLSVIVYTVFVVRGLNKDGAAAKLYLCPAVQVFEMASLFFLFMKFYSGTYKKSKATKKADKDTDPDPPSAQASDSSDDESSEDAKKKL